MRRLSAFMSTITLSGGLLVALSPASATIPPTPASMASVSTQGGTTVVIGSDGKPYGTGYNGDGQLTGDVDPLTTLTPLTGLPVNVRATAVVSSTQNVVVLGSNGKAYAAGSNVFHQISSGSTADKTTLTEIEWLVGQTVTNIDTNDNSIAAVLTDGSIKAAGGNRSSKFGDLGALPMTLEALPADEVAAQISIGFNGTAVRTTTGKIYTRGSSINGALASASGVPELVWTLEDDMLAVTARSVELDDDHLIALGSDGKVWGSGKNTDGNIGAGGDHDGLFAIDNPTTGADIVAVSTGSTHTVAIGDDGRLYGIGNNSYGQLTDHAHGPIDFMNYGWVPLASALAQDVTGVSAGLRATILIDDDGVLRGSGDNNNSEARGQITDGATNTAEFSSLAMKLLSGQVITNVAVPKISGTTQFTKTLTASPGSWTPSSNDIRFQWKSAGVDILGATSPTYAPSSSDIGKKISVVVTAKRGRFADGTMTSVETGNVIVAPALVFTQSKPTIKGTLKSGKTLSISKSATALKVGFNPDATTLIYRWYRNGATISGATKSTYKLTKKDKGKKISMRVYGAKSFYATGSYLTKAVKIKK